MIEIAEAVPFVALTEWYHQKIYGLKGQIVAAGIRHVTGSDMPTFEKRRFQHGAADQETFNRLFPAEEQDYRDEFKRIMEGKTAGV